MPNWTCQDQRKRQKYPLTNKYMTLHLPVMVHTLQDKVAWLTLSRIKNVNKNQAKKGVHNVNLKVLWIYRQYN